MTDWPEYGVWQGMRRRCSDMLNMNYGGRGISVCERWNSYANFLADMGPRPSPKHSIDRIDVNGNYEPSNCRWATPAEQAANKRPKSEWRGLPTGRPRKPPDEVRDRNLPNIRASEEEERRLKWGATKDGLPLTTWLRELGLMRVSQIEEEE